MLHRQPPGRSELRAEAVLRHDGAEAIRKPSPEELLELHRPRIRLLPAVRVLSVVRLAAYGRLSRGEVSVPGDTSHVTSQARAVMTVIELSTYGWLKVWTPEKLLTISHGSSGPS